MTDLEIYKELVPLADRFSKSNLIPSGFKRPEDALYAIALGHELGLSPIYSLNNIAVINGKPTLSADCKLAICKSSPEFGGVDIKDSSTSCTVTLKRKYANGTMESRTVTFTIEDAKKAGLMNKDVWAKYPARMLRARALGYACTDVFGDLLAGIYTPEEAESFSPQTNRHEPVVETPQYEVVETTPIIDKAELALALKDAKQALYDVPMVSSESDTFKAAIDQLFKDQNVDGLKDVASQLRERLESMKAAKAQEIQQENPANAAEEKAKTMIKEVLEKLIAKGKSRVYVRNSLKKHLAIESDLDSDWAAMLWAAPFDLDQYREAYKHWKAELDTAPSKLRKEAISLCKKSDEADVLLGMLDETSEEELPGFILNLKGGESEE